MAERKEKLVYLCTQGPENPEMATLPFSMALGAIAMGCDATIILQSSAVLLAKKEISDHVFAAGISPFREQMDLFLTDGGRVIVCTACLSARKIDKNMLDERVEIGSPCQV